MPTIPMISSSFLPFPSLFCFRSFNSYMHVHFASGRYYLVGRVACFSDSVKIAHEHYPSLRFTERCADDKPFPLAYELSKEKAKTLGIDFTPLEVSVKDTIESSREKGLFNV